MEKGATDDGDYRAYLEECFEGEVSGEAFFRTLAEHCQDPARARKLRALEQLERETKEFLLPAVRAAGGDTSEKPERIAEGEKLGATLAKVPWPELMAQFESRLEGFVAEFERSEALAPAGEEPVVQHVTAHERALLHFASREAEEPDASDSLEAVVALLRETPAA